jgi:hypothetical protein
MGLRLVSAEGIVSLHHAGAAVRPDACRWRASRLWIMSDATVNPEDAAAAARRLLEANVNARVDAVREVVDAANDADEKEREATEARERHSRAWDAAIKAGWSDKELRQTGARAPGAATPRRRTRRPSAASSAAPEAAEQPTNEHQD